jgi:phage tail-like protein
VSARRWLSGGDWSTARLDGLEVDGSVLRLAAAAPGLARHGFAVVPAGAPSGAEIDSTSADRWRAVHLRIADPLPPGCWLRIWLLVDPAAAPDVPPTPDPVSADDDRAAVPTSPGRWRAAALSALDARVLCPAAGSLWVAIELGGTGTATPRISDLQVGTGDDSPVTELPAVYRRVTALASGMADRETDGGDGLLGRYLALLADQLTRASSILAELPALLDPSVTSARDDAPWLDRLARWVAVDPEQLPDDESSRRETVATAAERHGWRGTRRGLLDQVRRETGLAVDIVEPLAAESVWRLDQRPATSALGLSTGLTTADPGPPVLDRSAVLDASMLIEGADAGLPVHARSAHRICVHVPGGTQSQVAAVDRVVQRERPAHVLARTCATTEDGRIPLQVGVSTVPGPDPRRRGLPNDTAHHPHIDGPGQHIGTARLPPAPHPHPAHDSQPTGDLP